MLTKQSTVPAQSPVPPVQAPPWPWWRRTAAVVALLAVAPWAAECSWGGNTLDRFLLVVLVLGPLYGGAAVLIRETARRTGGGWPTIVLLAAAFGVVQAGLVDQALFNPAFLNDTQYADQATDADRTRVPVLGFSAEQAFGWIANHIALSICAPIAIVEAFVGPRHRHRPWLGKAGLAVMVTLWVLGSLLIFMDAENGRKGFLLNGVQAAFAVAVVGGLIGAALLPQWRRPRPPVVTRTPPPLVGAVVGFVAYYSAGVVPGWPGVAVRTAVTLTALLAFVTWSRRAGWSQRHALAGWSGYLVAAAVGSFLVPNYEPASPTAALVGDISVGMVTFALVGGAFWRLRRETQRSPSQVAART